MTKRTLISLLFFVCSHFLAGQLPFETPTFILNGFGKAIIGPPYTYHSSISVASEGMLIRANDGNSEMEWETELVPQHVDEQFVTFVWLAGIGSSPGLATFDLMVNDHLLFTFKADGSNEWLLNGEGGSSLFFRKDMIDQYDDRFGFMYLTLPASTIEKGKAVRLKARGGNFQRTSWYMIFKLPMQDGLNIKMMPAFFNNTEGDVQLCLIGLLHFGKADTARVSIDNKLLLSQQVHFGYNYLRVGIPQHATAQKLHYVIETGQKKWSGEIDISKARKWRVQFVQHSHTDIGYTRPQTEILADHLRYIDYALDYCEMTDEWPDDAQFRWTCEASWAVSEYLKSRPLEQVNRLKKRLREGRMEITGMYFNFDELPSEQVLAASLQPFNELKDQGVVVKTAMQNDVNGIGWCLNDYFNDLDVKYLNMGTHGHRALICFDYPTLFWWESPSGKRMLAFRAEHYMTGNTVFNIHAGDFDIFEEKLLNYLVELEAKGYPFDVIAIQHSGFLTDNSPPSIKASEMIRKWNQKYAWPHLQTATVSTFFEEMEARYADRFQTIRAAWPDWWTDGFGASAREVAVVRQAQMQLPASSAALGMAALLGKKLPVDMAQNRDAANSALLFYTEHTVGYHGSVNEPFHAKTMEQRAMKESYAWEAARRTNMLTEAALGLLQSNFAREAVPSLLVFNTLNWKRSGWFKVYIDHQILPRHAPFRITDSHGNIAKAQPIERLSDGTYYAIWVDDVPAFGFKKYHILPDLHHDATPVTRSELPEKMENDYYSLKFDTATGTIKSLIDKLLGKELIDSLAPFPFGTWIHETLGNRTQMEQRKLTDFQRLLPDSVWFVGAEDGAVWSSVTFAGKTAAAADPGYFTVEYRLFHTDKRIDIQYFIPKKLETGPEGIYLAFPWKLNNGQLAVEVAGGEMRPGIDQISGSANDWNTMQQYVRLFNDEAQLVLHSTDAPLIQLGAINTGRYQAGALPPSNHVYGWPMNNYWVTNFNADQHGGHFWNYAFTSLGGNRQSEAARFGWSAATPFLVRILPGSGLGDHLSEGSFLQGFCDNILLINVIPDDEERSLRLHLRETDGQSCALRLINTASGQPLRSVQVDAAGREMIDGSTTIEPYESKFLKIFY